jgi:probable rRNA maturation factor
LRCDVIRVLIHDNAQSIPIDVKRIRAAVRAALALGDIEAGLVNVAIVDDPAIHELNARHLGHDYATDVLSFCIEQDATRVEGEIVVSTDTAVRMAAEFGWAAEDELLLYVVHGALHLAGFDDLEPAIKSIMRLAEREVLAQFGLKPRYEEDD